MTNYRTENKGSVGWTIFHVLLGFATGGVWWLIYFIYWLTKKRR